jgi:aspartyl-tRNA(Asn)/glutamyl-tRNA(Gln) amidotransferase subunit C
MADSKKINADDIKHLAQLAKLPISDERTRVLADQIESTFEYIDTLGKTDTQAVPETNQVAGLINVFREDKISPERTFSQADALKNARNTHNGYFLVPAILD